MLINYWDKLIGQMCLKATQINDKDIMDILKHIVIIPRHIREAVLVAYVNKCRELYQIAFFQWRKIYPNSINFNLEQIQTLIVERIEYTYERNSDSLTYNMPTPKTSQNSRMAKTDT